MTKREFKKGYPEGPPCFYKVKDYQLIYPGYIFCCEEHMGKWLDKNGSPPGLRGRKPWSVIRKAPKCETCGSTLWGD